MILNRLNGKLNDYVVANPTAAGCKVLVIEPLNQYKVKCPICNKKLKVNGQQKKPTHTKNWNIQSFTRHFYKRHLKPAIRKLKPN